jgi:hypothetical protein
MLIGGSAVHLTSLLLAFGTRIADKRDGAKFAPPPSLYLVYF